MANLLGRIGQRSNGPAQARHVLSLVRVPSLDCRSSTRFKVERVLSVRPRTKNEESRAETQRSSAFWLKILNWKWKIVDSFAHITRSALRSLRSLRSLVCSARVHKHRYIKDPRLRYVGWAVIAATHGELKQIEEQKPNKCCEASSKASKSEAVRSTPFSAHVCVHAAGMTCLVVAAV